MYTYISANDCTIYKLIYFIFDKMMQLHALYILLIF